MIIVIPAVAAAPAATTSSIYSTVAAQAYGEPVNVVISVVAAPTADASPI